MNNRNKFQACLRVAREASRDSWQVPGAPRKELRQVRREAIEDARYWRAKL